MIFLIKILNENKNDKNSVIIFSPSCHSKPTSVNHKERYFKIFVLSIHCSQKKVIQI